MDPKTLRAIQAPLKQKYRDNPQTALVVSRAEVALDPDKFSVILPDGTPRVAGLHPATGGSGRDACSGDMLLEALAACAGVTLLAVAKSMSAKITGGKVIAEGVWDARGTLAIDRTVPVGIQSIALRFEIEGEIDEAERERLVTSTERYCVVLATLRDAPAINVEVARPAANG